MAKAYKKVSLQKSDGSRIKIAASVEWKKLEEKAQEALQAMLLSAELPGFRKGKVPKDVFIEKVGEMTILEEGAERAIADAYPEIIRDQKLLPVSRPIIRITKLAAKNDLEFEAEVETMPDIELPDYKNIAKSVPTEAPDTTVTDEEVDTVLHNLQHQVMKTADEKENHPEINDEFAKKVGNFSSLDELKKHIRENIVVEKELRAKDKRRAAIAEKLISETKGDLPSVLLDDEARALLERLKFDLGNAGVKWDEYLKNINKTEQEILKEVRPDAEKRVRLEIAVAKIAKAEKLEPKAEEIKGEVDKILKMHASADPIRAEEYVRSVLMNRDVFRFLETL